MVPKVVANAGYFGRNNDSGSRSRSLLTGRQSLEYSTSQDRNYNASDIAFSYNILDFGLSYIRAKQAADRALSASEQRRKALVRIIEDTRTAYWRAVSSERLIARMRRLERDVQRSLGNTRRLARNGVSQPLPALTYERELLSIKRELQQLERNLVVARQQLAALVNLPPETALSPACAGPSRHPANIELALRQYGGRGPSQPAGGAPAHVRAAYQPERNNRRAARIAARHPGIRRSERQLQFLSLQGQLGRLGRQGELEPDARLQLPRCAELWRNARQTAARKGGLP